MFNSNISSNDSHGIAIGDKPLSADTCAIVGNGADGFNAFRASMEIRNCAIKSNASRVALSAPYDLALTGNTIEGNRGSGLITDFNCYSGGSIGADGIATISSVQTRSDSA